MIMIIFAPHCPLQLSCKYFSTWTPPNEIHVLFHLITHYVKLALPVCMGIGTCTGAWEIYQYLHIRRERERKREGERDGGRERGGREGEREKGISTQCVSAHIPIERIDTSARARHQLSSLTVLHLIAWHGVFPWTSSSRVWAKMAGQRTLRICLSPSQCWNNKQAQ